MMDMKTAKQILNENGFLLEDTNTKSLVGKFWSAKKGGAKLTKEESDELSDLLFNYDMISVINSVCGKYTDFIQNNFRKYSEGYVPPKKKYDDDPWAGVETMSDAQLKRWGHWH